MKLLVTGGCGFLGSNLVDYALSLGWEVCIFDNLSRIGASENLVWLKKRGSFEFVWGDIRNNSDVERCISRIRPDAVFHLAGQVAMTTSLSNPRVDFETNALGTLNVLESIRSNSPYAPILYSSTNKVYGDLEQFNYEEMLTRYQCLEHPHGFGEDVPLKFSSPYGCSKGAADQYMLDAYASFGTKTVVFRHSSMYGGRQFATEDQGWVGWFCEKAIELMKGDRKPFTISGNGKQVRDLLHANDVVSLYFTALSNIESVAGHALNIGGGIENSLSLLELFHLLEPYAENPMVYHQLSSRAHDQRVFIADIKRVTTLLPWRPTVNVKSGLAQMIVWISQQKQG